MSVAPDARGSAALGARDLPVAVLGAGSFGTALCSMLGAKGLKLHLWCHSAADADAINANGRNPRHFSDVELSGVTAFSDAAACVRQVQSVVFAVPSFAVRDVAWSIVKEIPRDLPLLLLSKGIDEKRKVTLAEVVGGNLGNISRVAVLGGPNHAEELVRGVYAGAVVASRSESCARYFQKLVSCDFFRIYTSDDICGVSLCGAAKNVIAIACGVARGLGYGDNTVALLITRGIAEIRRLVLACGGKESSCLGLAGIGDLNATCCSPHSRNGAFGEQLAHGVVLEDYERERGVVVEGAHSVASLLALAAEKDVELPIAQAVAALLSGAGEAAEMARLLTGRELKAEFEDA